MGQFHLLNVALCSAKFSYLEQSGIKEKLSKETGRDRVIRMYSKNEIGHISPELKYILKSASIMTVVSAFFGAVAEMSKAKDDFFRKNMASVYESQHLARRALTDTMSIYGLKGAGKYAFKYGTFGSLYFLSTMTVENYRNKFSIWEHMGSGAVIGGLSRFNYGPKGMLVAGCLGAFLGSIAGGIILFNMWIAGVSHEDFRYWQYENYYTNTLKKKVDQEKES